MGRGQPVGIEFLTACSPLGLAALSWLYTVIPGNCYSLSLCGRSHCKKHYTNGCYPFCHYSSFLLEPLDRIKLSFPRYEGGVISLDQRGVCEVPYGMVPLPRIELGPHPYHGCVLPLYYRGMSYLGIVCEGFVCVFKGLEDGITPF